MRREMLARFGAGDNRPGRHRLLLRLVRLLERINSEDSANCMSLIYSSTSVADADVMRSFVFKYVT